MAEAGEERTEEATPKRRDDARQRGQFARSMELPAAAALLLGTLALRATGPSLWRDLEGLVQSQLAQISRGDLSSRDAVMLISHATLAAALAVAPTLGAIGVTGIAIGLLQSGLNVSFKAIAPKFDRLNPIEGLKRLASTNTLFELVKMIARLAILGTIAFTVLGEITGRLTALATTNLLGAPGAIGEVAQTLILRVALAGGALAAADYGFQRWRFNRELRMTRQEIRDEHRQIEGDPQIKARMRKLQRQRARNRMMREVPKATLVLANPTHYAVALRYASGGKMRAPIVVAKGQDEVAQRIKALAREHHVPVIEEPALARALHTAVPLGSEIPLQFYRAVAEVLALIYQLKRRW